MIQVIKQWFHRYFSDPQAVLLVALLVSCFTILITMGQMLAPVLASIVVAYLLEGLAGNLQRWHFPRWLAISIVYFAFITLLVFIIFILLPLLSNQLSQLIQELPTMLTRGQELLERLPERYPEFISIEQINSMISSISYSVRNAGQTFLSASIASIPAIISLLIYLILVPLLVFFFMYDKTTLMNWFSSFLPKERHTASKLWQEMDLQMGNYVRGKVYEIFIIGTFTYIAFALMGLNYASLLAFLVGISVIIPYIGAVVVTIPVVIVAYFQWGWGSEFFWLLTIFTILQAFDGNILVPLLFSEAVNLHPVAIIVAVLVFGGLWGFWGIFFAIPLASLVKALLQIWPRTADDLA